ILGDRVVVPLRWAGEDLLVQPAEIAPEIQLGQKRRDEEERPGNEPRAREERGPMRRPKGRVAEAYRRESPLEVLRHELRILNPIHARAAPWPPLPDKRSQASHEAACFPANRRGSGATLRRMVGRPLFGAAVATVAVLLAACGASGDSTFGDGANGDGD